MGFFKREARSKITHSYENFPALYLFVEESVRNYTTTLSSFYLLRHSFQTFRYTESDAFTLLVSYVLHW